MHANVALDISRKARADRGQRLLEWASAGGSGGGIAVGAKGAAAGFWSCCELRGLGQRGKIEKRMEKDGEVYRDAEGERET